MSSSRRITAGALVEPTAPIEFEFDGRGLVGLAGDTVASALLANGVRLVGRSFKYHRPRGIISAGPEEPCALIDVQGVGGRAPNRPATTVSITAGLRATSQNRWPSLNVDLLSINSLFAAMLPAGFYYKTFMSPGKAWERLYEPAIRRAAGLGVLRDGRSDAVTHGEHTVHDHTDVLIIGSGAAGLAAARRLQGSGLRVMLLERDVVAGGGTLLDTRWQHWRESALTQLTADASLQCLTRTQVIAAYDHGVFAAVETLAQTGPNGLPQERLRVIRTKRVLLATGANERWIACDNNDRPGVMQAGAALAYLRRYGVAVGARPVLFANSDWAYESAFALHEAGVTPRAIVDPRRESAAAERARALGITVHAHSVVTTVHGRRAVEGVQLGTLDGAAGSSLDADCLLLSGGYQPESALATQAGGSIAWRDELAAFVAALPRTTGVVAGATAGAFGLAAAASDGAAAAERIAAELGVSLTAVDDDTRRTPVDPVVTPLQTLWEVPGRGKAFVDLQHDVTVADIRLAHREGYTHIEHMKRYTTHGMATDQGRTGGMLGAAILAAARGQAPHEVGLPTPRPYIHPTSFAVMAGGEVGAHLRPVRHFPAHAAHVACGAIFVPAGLWLRPLVYATQAGWEPVLRESRAVRSAAGIGDASSLGKIDVQGPDSARFLDYIYANRFSSLAVGKARYGIMLREDGYLLDDGTTSRLGAQHFLLTTTTANHTHVLEHLEFQLQVNRPDLDVVLTDVTDQWAQFSIAGPRARDVLQKVMPGVDVSGAAVPFMAALPAQIAGVWGRLFRISFSGELAYEVAVPSSSANEVWNALLEAGRPFGALPYGVDALNTLRIEKGHVTTAELDGNASAHMLGFERMLKADGDYVGRVLAQRPALTSPDRAQLVGVRPSSPRARLRTGAQLVESAAPTRTLGVVTSCTPSVLIDGWVGLAMLTDGKRRQGTRLLAVSPVHGESVEVEVTTAHWFDPENARVRA
ncbi:MAG: FAD-dependent oxidoreductase [Sinobacteraceae bacterium]|nr:FAD-dependent oxidoreductase [Nevskiaceae bacterium]